MTGIIHTLTIIIIPKNGAHNSFFSIYSYRQIPLSICAYAELLIETEQHDTTGISQNQSLGKGKP
jgi:hypothetical protein